MGLTAKHLLIIAIIVTPGLLSFIVLPTDLDHVSGMQPLTQANPLQVVVSLSIIEDWSNQISADEGALTNPCLNLKPVCRFLERVSRLELNHSQY